MTVRAFLISSLIAGFAGIGSWLLVVNYLDPATGAWLGLTLFFLSLFVAGASVFSLAGYLFRRLLMPRQFASYAVRTSLRQGGVLSVFCVLILLLQLMRLYRWWIAIIMVVLLVSFELIFVGYDRSSRNRSQSNPV